MPLSNDNQDYGQKDEKNKGNEKLNPDKTDELTTDDLKGKKVDADLTQQAEQQGKE